MENFRRPKLIFDPLLGRIDVTEILPLLDQKEFQLLGFKYQLGFAFTIFPAATHTRKQHSLGAYERTKKLTSDWLNYGFIDSEQAKSLGLYALYHDIGHGPFSHTTEDLGIINHDERGLKIIEGIRDKIENAGFDYGKFHDFFSRKDNFYLAVFDKNLGMEKLDYLERDAFYTLGERPGVEFLAKHVYFIENQIVIDEIAIDQAKAIQDFYIRMSKQVYLRKKSAMLQRVIQKMAFELKNDGLSEEALFNLSDFGLLGKFEDSKNKLVQFYYRNFINGISPKLTIELKDKAFVHRENENFKLVKVLGLERNIFDSVILSGQINGLSYLDKVEKDIAKITNIPQEKIIVVPPFSKERFEPKDIKVYTKEGKIELISKIYPNHFEAMKEYGRSHLSLRIGVFNDYRESLYNQAEKVKNYFLNLNKL